jgi:UDP-N-acetylmuramoylalanine--D-glutamate ligase
MCTYWVGQFENAIIMKNTNLKDKRVLVVGLGGSGIAASRLLLEKGAAVWITEKADNVKIQNIAHEFVQKGAVVEIGKHTEDFVREKDFIVISPGVNARHEVVLWAEKYKIPVISELELASWYIDYPLICVTGTNGKSTVTTLVDYILKCAGKRTIGCGNLGMPLSEVVLNYKNLDYGVVEVSSFQLEFIKEFKPYISVWLNFSYDHLDHHASMDEYLKAKLRVFENQTSSDWAVIYYEENKRVGGLKAKKIIYGDKSGVEFVVEDAFLKGKHNHDNIQAAFAVSKICGVESEIIKNAVKAFRPLSHRMEYVDTIDNVTFIDDSKATNVHAVIPALNSLNYPVILILGGRDKGDDFTRLKDFIKEKVKTLIVIGEAKEKIIKQLKGVVDIFEASTLDEAVQNAMKCSVPGGTVMLSPGCSSFDMFKDYKERGENFKEAVTKLKTRNTKQKIDNRTVLHVSINKR